MKKQKKLFIISAFLVLVVSLTAISIRIIYFLPGPGMVLPFKQVQEFTRKDAFAASFLGNEPVQLDILGKGGRHTIWLAGKP